MKKIKINQVIKESTSRAGHLMKKMEPFVLSHKRVVCKKGDSLMLEYSKVDRYYMIYVKEGSITRHYFTWDRDLYPGETSFDHIGRNQFTLLGPAKDMVYELHEDEHQELEIVEFLLFPEEILYELTEREEVNSNRLNFILKEGKDRVYENQESLRDIIDDYFFTSYDLSDDLNFKVRIESILGNASSYREDRLRVANRDLYTVFEIISIFNLSYAKLVEKATRVRGALMKQYQEQAKKMEEFFDAHLKTATIKEACEHIGVAKPTMITICEKVYGLMPRDVLKNKRIESIKDRLANTDDDLEKIVQDAGYKHSQAVRVAFKAYVGETFIRYRKRFRG